MGLNAPVGADDGEVWPPYSTQLAFQFYPDMRDWMGTVSRLAQTSEKVGRLQLDLQAASRCLAQIPAIMGSPAACRGLSQELAAIAQAIGAVETGLGREQSTLQQAWQGRTGTRVQRLMSDISEDAKSVREMSELGAVTLARFANELEQVQSRETGPRFEVFKAATTLSAGQEIAKSAFLSLCETLGSDCEKLAMTRQQTRQTLLTARDSLRSRQLVIERAITIDPPGGDGDNGGLVYDSDTVRESTKALSEASNTLLDLITRARASSEKPDLAGAGELIGEVANFQTDERSALGYLEDRVNQLAAAMRQAGLDLALTDHASALQVCTVVSSDSGIGGICEPVEQGPEALPREPAVPGTTEPGGSSGISGMLPGGQGGPTVSDGTATGSVPGIVQPPVGGPVTGSRRDPDDKPRVTDNLRKMITPLNVEPDQLRRMTIQHDEIAQSPVDTSPDYYVGAPASEQIPQPTPGPAVTAPR